MRTVFEQPAAKAVRQQVATVIATLDEQFPKASEHLERAREDLLAFVPFPRAIWKVHLVEQRAGTAEQGDPAPHRCRRIGRTSAIPRIGAVLAEQSNERAKQRRYIGPEILDRCRPTRSRETSKRPPRPHSPHTRKPDHRVAVDTPPSGRDPTRAGDSPKEQSRSRAHPAS
ncbi:transposase (plasmid) [Kitasatospora sp. NBC_00070]